MLAAKFLRLYFHLFSTLFFTHMDIIASNHAAAIKPHLSRVERSDTIRENPVLGKILAA